MKRRAITLAVFVGTVLGATALQASANSAAPAPVCSWGLVSDPNTVNVAFPDESATYWATQFAAVPGTDMVIHGSFPRARYFSIIAYDPVARPVDGLRDDQIVSDSGLNPFQAPNARDSSGTYTIRIVPEAKPANPAPNTIYAGQMHEGEQNTTGSVLYRVYVPDDRSDPTGGVGLPTVAVEGPGAGVQGQSCTIVNQLPDTGVNKLFRDSSYPSALTPPVASASTTNPPTWGKFFGYGSVVGEASPSLAALAPGGGGFYSNIDNQYIGTPLSHKYGNVVVFRAVMPTFPDTVAGQPAWMTAQQVRYWSICENESVSTRYVACVPDYKAVLDSQGRGTFVISDPDARPANATAANEVNWLPWGDYADGRIIYRQMLAAPSFTQAISNIQPGQSLQSVMGPYLPQIAYCTTQEFERAGADGCLAGQ